MSDPELDLADLIYDLETMYMGGYVYCSALALLIYDSLCIFPQEVKYLYRWPWSIIQAIYILLRVCTCIYLISNVYGFQATFLSKSVCLGIGWSHKIIIDIIIPSIMKILLIIRVRAIWDYNIRVTIALVFITALDILLGIVRTVIVGVIYQQYSVGGTPVHDCFEKYYSPSDTHLLDSVEFVVLAGRCIITGIEVLLILVRLFQALKQVKLMGHTFYERMVHIKRLMPVIYVFYRDGTLLIIPIFGTSMLAFANTLSSKPIFGAVDLGGWLALVYYICGTRLVLNLREVNCKITESILPQNFSDLQFNHETGQSRDEAVSEDEEEVDN
ncbi:hypothetical protein P691DRAFT_780073 [Macrolepiota fuliginosa MF-IS2]|uniref:DUF6533 domain-containing protein n=1 Tax=Macrolepiota fuliginosa MF-IS2 TaxID=1400762 RepID=A0A9P5WWR6_9AGAR|nr:hypothetical protein P691DRAFT_780073 [Macrolepiota fuliginosa MF-IS2]